MAKNNPETIRHNIIMLRWDNFTREMGRMEQRFNAETDVKLSVMDQLKTLDKLITDISENLTYGVKVYMVIIENALKICNVPYFDDESDDFAMSVYKKAVQVLDIILKIVNDATSLMNKEKDAAKSEIFTLQVNAFKLIIRTLETAGRKEEAQICEIQLSERIKAASKELRDFQINFNRYGYVPIELGWSKFKLLQEQDSIISHLEEDNWKTHAKYNLWLIDRLIHKQFYIDNTVRNVLKRIFISLLDQNELRNAYRVATRSLKYLKFKCDLKSTAVHESSIRESIFSLEKILVQLESKRAKQLYGELADKFETIRQCISFDSGALKFRIPAFKAIAKGNLLELSQIVTTTQPNKNEFEIPNFAEYKSKKIFDWIFKVIKILNKAALNERRTSPQKKIKKIDINENNNQAESQEQAVVTKNAKKQESTEIRSNEFENKEEQLPDFNDPNYWATLTQKFNSLKLKAEELDQITEDKENHVFSARKRGFIEKDDKTADYEIIGIWGKSVPPGVHFARWNDVKTEKSGFTPALESLYKGNVFKKGKIVSHNKAGYRFVGKEESGLNYPTFKLRIPNKDFGLLLEKDKEITTKHGEKRILYRIKGITSH